MGSNVNDPLNGTSQDPKTGGGQSTYPTPQIPTQIGDYDLGAGKIYTAFNLDTDVVTNFSNQITAAVWSLPGTGSIESFFSSSVQVSASGDYYYDVYAINPQTDSNALIEFDLAYGHLNGSGSGEINVDANDPTLTPSKAIYSQYRNVLLSPLDYTFTLGDGRAMRHFVAVNFMRERIKERLDPGNWELSLKSGSLKPSYTFIDDYTGNPNGEASEAGQVFNVVSGSLDNGIYSTAGYCGLMYPDHGLILFDADWLIASASINLKEITLIDQADNNITTFFKALNNAGAAGLGFTARNMQSVSSAFYYVRVKNKDYNFTNNPTFTTGSLGMLRFSEMVEDPQVYITSVGLYNPWNELIAVAKISQPILKSFTTEALIRIKVDF